MMLAGSIVSMGGVWSTAIVGGVYLQEAEGEH